MHCTFKPAALRQLRKLPKDIQRRILHKLEFFAVQPDPLEHAEPLVRHEIGEYHFRIGDWRVIFDIDNDTLVILLIGHRREIYR